MDRELERKILRIAVESLERKGKETLIRLKAADFDESEWTEVVEQQIKVAHEKMGRA